MMINWKWFIVEGIILFVLGIFAIAQPGIAAEAIVMLIGWFLLFVGGVAMLGGATSQVGPRKPVSLGGGLVAIIFGLIFLLMPSPAIATITVVLAIFFLMMGFAEISSSMALRSSGGHSNHWGLAFFSGLIGVILGVMMLAMWPSSYEIIGLFLGINFLLGGSYLFSLGWFFWHAPAH
jgi:uncharacterized membrane protein HdeD (DUF308 family)